MKNKSVVFALALSALAAGSVVACGGSVENPASQTQASAAAKAPIAPQAHGVVKVMGEALGEVSLRPDQRAEIEQLAVSAEQRHASLASGKKDLVLAFADQVEKGSIDRAALQAKADAMVTEFEKNRPDDAAALTRLHAILDSDQRGEFVDALESKMKEKHHGGEKGLGLHTLKQLGEDMKLTEAQRGQIKDAIKGSHDGAHAKHLGEGKKALEAFREDTFDANAIAPSQEVIRQRVADGSSKLVTIAEKILPLLSPDQRKYGADKLRSLANNGFGMP